MIDKESSLYKDIYKRILSIKEDYKFEYYKEDEKEYIEKWVDTMYLILTTNMNFLEIEQSIRDSLKYRIIVELDIREIDFVHTVFKIACLHFGISIDDIKKKYSIPYEEVEERMFYRTELYKEKWDIESIEKYVFRYLLKTDYIPFDKDYYSYYYKNIFIIYYGVSIQETKNKKGRPSLPNILKNHSIERHKNVIKENMRKKYKVYGTVKINLLSDEEKSLLESKFEDKNDPLLIKIKSLFTSN